MKDLYICADCGFVSTIKCEFAEDDQCLDCSIAKHLEGKTCELDIEDLYDGDGV